MAHKSSLFPRANCAGAKAALSRELAKRVEPHSFVTLQKMGISYASVVALRGGSDSGMSLEKTIVAIRLLGGKVAITLDGIELPVGE